MFTELILFTHKFVIPETRRGPSEAQVPGMFEPSYTILHMLLKKILQCSVVCGEHEIHPSHFRIQSEGAEMDEYEEQISEPAQCSQHSSKEMSAAASPQCGATKSYKCQICNEIFLTVHQLFSHELRDHEHIGTSQINHIKKPLSKYNQHEKVFSSKNDVCETRVHNTNQWTGGSFTNNSQTEEGNLQTDVSNVGMHTFNVAGTFHGQDGDQQTPTSSMEGKSQKQDGNQEIHSSSMEEKSENQDGNQQAHISIKEEKSEKQDQNEQTHTSNMEERSQKQDGTQQIHISDLEEKSQKGNQQTYISNREGKSQEQDGKQQRHVSSMEGKSQKQEGNEQIHTSSMEEIKSDQSSYLQCEEPCISDKQHSKCELHYLDKETTLVEQGKGNFESNFLGEETTSAVVGLTEPATSSECEVISLPYKCCTCEERFQTRCQLFYHDLEVHVGITKPETLHSKDISLKSSQKNVNETRTLNEVAMKRAAENILKEQQPMKVIITEKETTGEEVNEKNEKSERRRVSFKKARAGNKLIQKLIVKQKIVQGDGKEIEVNSGNLELIRGTIQAITAKYPWNETLFNTGEGNEVNEHDAEIQPKTFVIVKDDLHTGKGNQKTTGGYRIDVVTNYVLSQSQIKQLLMVTKTKNNTEPYTHFIEEHGIQK
jgi:hypothetical protein